jgi:hypothetical protein
MLFYLADVDGLEPWLAIRAADLTGGVENMWIRAAGRD